MTDGFPPGPGTFGTSVEAVRGRTVR